MSESKSEQGGGEKERVRKNALLLFSKPPIPGLVKTRLTVLKDGVFQPEVASGLYHCMLFDVVEICCAAMADLERESAERAPTRCQRFPRTIDTAKAIANRMRPNHP